MAEQVPYAVVANMINTLASAAFRELGLICGGMDGLERLRITLESIKAVLRDAEERQDQDRAVQRWITRLKDVLYHADDLLDEFFIKHRRHNVDSDTKNKMTKVFHSLSPRGHAIRLKMAHKFEKVQKSFNDVVQEMSRLNLFARTVVIEETNSVLIGKKYLDDTRSESLEKWSQLKAYLMCCSEDSNVLVTPRSKVVAQNMGVNAPYVLNGLTEEESWIVLRKITFGDDTIGVNQTLESIGKKIAKKCRGVMLAIRTLGGLLQSKSEESEWMDVLQGDFWKSCENEGSIMPILKLSYRSLSPQMRQCFSYCALYPKDWAIPKDELIGLWMGQGYLQCSDENELMEDVGNRFVKIFLMKSFFQDVKMTEDGDIYSFKMHDLIHDLARQVAGNDFCCLNSDAKRVVGRPMHVFLQEDSIGLLDSLDASRVRTLILYTCLALKEEQLSSISNFKYLRSLSIRSCFICKLPESVGNLKHLRYLFLGTEHSAGEESIPKSISNLVCLQTLGLYECLLVEFFENVCSKLVNLRHLYMYNMCSLWVTNSKWNSSLANIVEISLVKCKTGRTIQPLEHLALLKSLCIHYQHELEFIYLEEVFPGRRTFFPSLEKLSFISCNRLRGWCKMGDDFDNADYLRHLSLLSFPRLSHLSIRNCEKLICMPTFPNLDKILTLINCPGDPLEATLNMAATSSTCPVYSTPLSKLNFLCIDSIKVPNNWMKNLTSLQHLSFEHFSVQALQEIETHFKDGLHWFPSLKRIDMYNSQDLEALPEWMCNLSSLQHIKVSCCFRLASLPEAMPRLTNLQTLEIIQASSRLIEECKNETSAARHKIAHIPNIILN